MNKKREEIILAGLNHQDPSFEGGSSSGTGNRAVRNLQQTSEVPSMIDSELLTDDKSSSHLTSNIDSVYSFYN